VRDIINIFISLTVLPSVTKNYELTFLLLCYINYKCIASNFDTLSEILSII